MLSVIKGLVGLTRSAMMFAVGISSRSSSSRFGTSSVFMLVTPVTFPGRPGEASNKTRRDRISSHLEYDGIVAVAAFAASAAGVLPGTAIAFT